MPNYNVINASSVNGTILTWDLLLDNISFNNYWIQNERIVTEWDWFWLRDYPDRRISLNDIPQGDWQILNDTFFGGRTVSVSWYLKWDDREDLNDLIDEFKLKMSEPNKLLKWRINNVMREINATVSDLSFDEKDNIIIPFTVTFESQDAFWRETIQQNFLIEWMSDNSRNEDITNNYKTVSY